MVRAAHSSVMTWLIALAVVGVIVSLTLVMHRPPKRGKGPTFQPLPVSQLGLADDDAQELVEMGHRVEQEFGLAPVQILLNRLGNVTKRCVPLRAVKPGPARGLARICFADGTTVQVRGRQMGDLGQLAVTAITQKVWVSDYHAEHSNVVLEMGWKRGHVSVLAVGLDQED